MTKQMPYNFRYSEAFLKGRPQHRKYDDFYIKHPFMDTGKRAKIFAPFDALTGFYDLVLSKEVQYVEKAELDEEQQSDLNSKMNILDGLIQNTADAREKQIAVSVTYYIPCDDVLNEAYGERGRYITVSGIARKVDAVFRQLMIGDMSIDFDDIYSIDGQIFRKSEAGG